MIASLTVAQIKKACASFRFIMVRTSDGKKMAVNTSCGNASLRKHNPKDSDPTNWISWKPISFQEYITNKRPFL